MKYCNAKPVPRLSDDPRAKAFYEDILGFEGISGAGDPVVGFGIFRAGDAKVCLRVWEGAKVSCDGWGAHFHLEDPVPRVDHLTGLRQPFKGPTDTNYNMREVEVTDPDGKVLCFGTGIPQTESTSP